MAIIDWKTETPNLNLKLQGPTFPYGQPTKPAVTAAPKVQTANTKVNFSDYNQNYGTDFQNNELSTYNYNEDKSARWNRKQMKKQLMSAGMNRRDAKAMATDLTGRLVASGVGNNDDKRWVNKRLDQYHDNGSGGIERNSNNFKNVMGTVGMGLIGGPVGAAIFAGTRDWKTNSGSWTPGQLREKPVTQSSTTPTFGNQSSWHTPVTLKPLTVEKPNFTNTPQNQGQDSRKVTPKWEDTRWGSAAKAQGFKTEDEVKAWQTMVGLDADGKFGEKSQQRWNALKNAGYIANWDNSGRKFTLYKGKDIIDPKTLNWNGTAFVSTQGSTQHQDPSEYISMSPGFSYSEFVKEKLKYPENAPFGPENMNQPLRDYQSKNDSSLDTALNNLTRNSNIPRNSDGSFEYNGVTYLPNQKKARLNGQYYDLKTDSSGNIAFYQNGKRYKSTYNKGLFPWSEPELEVSEYKKGGVLFCQEASGFNTLGKTANTVGVTGGGAGAAYGAYKGYRWINPKGWSDTKKYLNAATTATQRQRIVNTAAQEGARLGKKAAKLAAKLNEPPKVTYAQKLASAVPTVAKNLNKGTAKLIAGALDLPSTISDGIAVLRGHAPKTPQEKEQLERDRVRYMKMNYGFMSPEEQMGSATMYQQGGSLSKEDQQEKMLTYATLGVIGYANANKKAMDFTTAVSQVMQLAKENPETLQEIASSKELIQSGVEILKQQEPKVLEMISKPGGMKKIIEQLSQKAPMAKQGTKLNYIKHLKGICPEGYEVVYMAKGGAAGCPVCKKAAKGTEVPEKVEKEKPVTGGVSNTMNSIKADLMKCGGKKKIVKNQNPAKPITKKTQKLDHNGVDPNSIVGKDKEYQKLVKKGDQAGQDSLLINKYNDQEAMMRVPEEAKIKYGNTGKWTPNRNHSYYKKK